MSGNNFLINAFNDEFRIPVKFKRRFSKCHFLNLWNQSDFIFGKTPVWLTPKNTGKAAITKKYLGVDTLGDADNPLVYQTSQTVNALPFLAYQKIYYDFFSNSQWEKHLAYAYNVDYWPGTGQILLVTDMVKLRYANYPKDYFMGMLPSSQYGSVAALPSDIAPSQSPNRLLFFSETSGSTIANLDLPSGSTAPVASNSSSSLRYGFLNSDLSARIVTGKQIGRAHV